MKTSNKSSIITGVVLLALAALFTISLILQPLDFGVANPGHNNILFLLGNMLYSVYGFSSILIPAFLLISGLSCFASQWTARKTMRLLTALIPFFTCVVTENIIRSILLLGSSTYSSIKIIIALVTGAMLIVIEYLGIGIIADKISNKSSNPNPKYNKLSKVKIPEAEENVEENEPSVFDEALSEVNPDTIEPEVIPEEETAVDNIESDETVIDDNEESEHSKTVITQEEFAALTTPEPIENNDELEWPDLPPQPDKLPPEYDADFDENDPALEFPPKDEEEKTEIQEEQIEETPFSTAKYIDSVVENPKFPHGITIHDEETDEISEEPEEKTEKPLYSSKITLGDDNDEEEISDSDDYVEDETLPFPNFDIEEPAINTKPAIYNNQDLNFDSDTDFEENFEGESELSGNTDNSELTFESQSEKEPETEDSLNDFFDSVDSSFPVQTTQDSFDDDETENSFDENTEPVNLSTAAATVFSDMEADIRSTQPVKTESSVHPNTANNLTADELSDFFTTQQAENTPKTKEIAATPTKAVRALKKGPYIIPSDLLTAYKDDQYWIIDDATKQASLNLKQTLAEFNIEADVIGIKKGPVVTMFEILPAPGVKLSKIVALQDNIALSLAAQSVRIVAPIPGKQAVGIEVPNKNRSVVGFREIIEMDLPEWKKMAVPVILGKDILGKAQLIDLVKTPHMLIAGATGSGKSVCVNSLILSILYKRSYNDVKLILVDPKVVELKLYNNIPHLLVPVITEPKKAIQALQWCLCEMERRYALLDSMGVRDISNYNAKIKEQKICTEKLPYIVVIIDEFADLMATSGKELESIVARLTAMSRAVGIHLVLATQRPSVNVITGLIKANIPTRIAFMVASRTDSNIIIDAVGAEKLLGRGDMLYASAVDPAPVRIQGTFVSDQEVENVVTAVKEYGEPDYLEEEMFTEDDDEDSARDLFGEPMDDDDPLYDQALEIVVQEGKASASYLQRRLKIGYNRAARLVEEMEERGIVGPANGSKPREVIHIPG